MYVCMCERMYVSVGGTNGNGSRDVYANDMRLFEA